MSFKVTPRLAREAIIGTQLDRAVASMATDIHARSAELAPKKDRHLVNSGRIIRKSYANYLVKYVSTKVPYARIHELGGWTVRNYATYIQPKRYLTQAGESVTRGNLDKYFRGLSV